MYEPPHQREQHDSLTRAVMISLVVHLVILVASSVIITSTSKLPPEEIMQVRIVGAPVAAPAAAKKPVEQEPIRTQDSAAPKEPPPVTKDMPESTAKTKVIAPEEKPKVEEKKEDVEAKKRPPVLDKTPEKKKVVKNDLEAKVVKNPEDYLNELDFLDTLEENSLKPDKPVEESTEEAGEGDIIQLNMSEQGEANKIREHIGRFWNRPLGADNTGLSIIVRVTLDEMGTVTGVRIVKSSGQSAFDNSLDRAIRRASPLPLPQQNRSKFLKLDLHFQG